MRQTHLLLRGALGALRKRPPYEGARLPTRTLRTPAARIDGRHVAAYAEVCGFPPAGGAGPLPASYPHLLGFPLALRLMAAADFPFPLPGLVHTGIEVDQHRALRPEDRPEIRVHAEGLAPHRRGSEFRMVTTALLDCTEVWSSRSTYLCRHHRPDATDAPAHARPAPEGLLPELARLRLPADLGRRYGAVSGDRNPIHLHPLTARAFGFRRPIAHGMWTFARCLAEAAPAAAPDATHDQRGALTARARFLAPVPLPGEVVLLAQGGAFALRDGRDRTRLHVSGTVSSGPPS